MSESAIPRFRTAIAQINTTVGDLEGNSAKVISAIREAEKNHALFITFPELTITGYPPEDLLLRPQFIRENLRHLEAVTANTGDIIAIVGFADLSEGKVYNAAAILHRKRVVSVYRKVLLPNYGVFDEKRYFEPASRTSVFTLGALRFGVNICEDIYQPLCPAVNQCVSGDADLLFNISASPYFAGKRVERETRLRRLAKQNGVFIVYTNLVGGQDELIFDGYSMVLDRRGEIIASAAQFREDLVYVDLEIPGAVGRMRKRGEGEMRGVSVDSLTIPGTLRPVPKETFRPPRRTRPVEGCEEIFQALILGVREYVTKNRFEKALVGLSGGIDSALVAVIATEALGAGNVIGVTMPSLCSSRGSVLDSSQLAENLGIRLMNLPIASVVEGFGSVLAGPFRETRPGLAEENLQARIRGTLLMTLSNKFGWLVLTTGNKSETSVGYCTLYGDMAGGFAVIKDVYKTMVYKLAGWINASRQRPLIPVAILEKEPSAELRPDQKDSDSLPPYEVLDPILRRYVEEKQVLGEMVREGLDPEIVRGVLELVDRNEYKRRQAPPGIKITPRAFGRDRRLPIVNWYRPKP